MSKRQPLVSLFEVVSEVGQADEYGWLKQVDYRLATLPELREYVEPALRQRAPISCDWETTGLNHYDGSLQIVGLSVSAKHATARYVPICHFKGAELNQPLIEVARFLREIDAAGHTSLWYNYRYDGEVCWAHLGGWEPTHWDDPMIAVWLQDSNQKQIGLKFTALRLLGLRMREYGELFGETSLAQFHPEEVREYTCSDTDLTRRLWKLRCLQETVKEQRFIYDLEKDFHYCVREGVRHGVYLDVPRLMAYREEIGTREHNGTPATGLIRQLQDEIFAMAGKTFALNSPAVLGQALIEAGVPITEQTKKNRQVQTGEEVLAKYAADHPICERVLRYRRLESQVRNYIDKLIAAADHFGPHVRFPFNPLGAPTGRMSAGGEGKRQESYSKGLVDLNVQSLPDPKKEPYLPNIRACIIANDPRTDSDEWVIVAIDYSQVELRVAGNLSREPAWIKTYSDPRGDIHTTNARLAYNDPTITSDSPKRSFGKTMSFAILFGASDRTVAQHGRIPVKEARRLVETFLGGAPVLKEWIDRTQAQAQATQQIATHFGRVRRLTEYFRPEVVQNKDLRWLVEKGKREAINHPVQGTAADLFKQACHKVRLMLRQHGWTKDFIPVLWLHDELVAVARRQTLEQILPWVKRQMEFTVQDWPIRLKVDIEVGWDWGTLQSRKEFNEHPVPKPKYGAAVVESSEPADVDFAAVIPVARLA